MSEHHAKPASSIEKICQDSECSERISALNPDQQKLFKTFTYCPYCAEELTFICHSCREQLNSSDYKFCPWCGAQFDDAELKR
ncbi:MAG: hypothetical protein LBP95_05710 [Deltaproteobacteria bacterium]|jgi:predicted RNA-binding Zn-ribbon protein involved in translation (DUF1610 family)|nr:hypothetical protein [Deltaproteobacteria bacterium]MDR1296465.1 hypothetical protein [Deltaproteobacteria bacterium]